MTGPHQQLKSDLDAICTRAKAVLRREHRRRVTWPALRSGATLSASAGLGLIAYLGLSSLGGLPFPDIAWPGLSAIVLVPGALYALIQILAATARAVSADRALAAADARHDLADRLRAATEFLGTQDRSPFMDAALVDATAYSAKLKNQVIPEHTTQTGSPSAALGWISLALMFIAAACWIPAPTSIINPTGPDKTRQVAQLEPIGARQRPESKSQAPTPKPEEPKSTSAQQPRQQTARPSRQDSQVGAEQKKTQGTMGSGQSADAASASGKSRARGAPSSQAQASKTGKKS